MHPIIPVIERQRQANFCVRGHPGVCSEFQARRELHNETRKEENEERTLLMQEESRHQPRGKELLPLGAQILSPDPVYAGIYLQGKGCVFAS